MVVSFFMFGSTLLFLTNKTSLQVMCCFEMLKPARELVTKCKYFVTVLE